MLIQNQFIFFLYQSSKNTFASQCMYNIFVFGRRSWSINCLSVWFPCSGNGITWVAAGTTASKCNKCINTDIDDYEKYRGLLGFYSSRRCGLCTNSYVPCDYCVVIMGGKVKSYQFSSSLGLKRLLLLSSLCSHLYYGA